MASTTWTMEQLTALENAIAKGIRIVRYDDKTIEYRSLNEMLTLRNEMRRCLGLVKKGGRILVETCKGTD
jgi:hypothetical protein